MITEHYRLDVIFEGAVELAENFTPEDAENEYNYQIEDLREHHPNESWVVSIYDEGAEPPELVKETSNDPQLCETCNHAPGDHDDTADASCTVENCSCDILIMEV